MQPMETRVVPIVSCGGAIDDGHTTTTMPAPAHAETDRLAALHRLGILETSRERVYDEITALAAQLINVPMAAITLIDRDRHWSKSAVGVDVNDKPRAVAFCDHVVATDSIVVVNDATRDLRFAASALVVGDPHVRFYAGVPLHSDALPVGALCVMGPDPRELSEADAQVLTLLARQAEQLMELQWRRQLEAPPQPREVGELAAAIHDTTSFSEACERQHRPAWVYDIETLEFLAVNERALEHYGWSRDRWLQMTILDIRPIDNAAVLEAAIRNNAVQGYISSRTWQHVRADGSRMDVQVATAQVVFEGIPARLVVMSDITTRLHSQELLLYSELHDHLTGLPNRRHFLEQIGARAEASIDDITVMIVGLDRFKLVNDAAGHETGDTLLGSVAARIAAACPPDAVVARLGGDEFAVAMHTDSRLDAVAVADAVLASVCTPIQIRGGEYYLMASIGITVGRPQATPHAMLAEADVALYAAEQSRGRNVVVFDDDMRSAMAEWSAIQRDLHHAIERDEFELEYQPIFDFSGTAVSFEALLRWNHPVRGLVMPGIFIHVAEETGLIAHIGRWVLHEAGRAAALLDVDISFNVSVHQFNEALVTDFGRVMDEHRLRPGQLIIEVTESALADTHLSQRIINGLRSRGARIWIDDFGTGYSSLSRLSELTVDAFKLDQSFIANVGNAEGVSIAKSVIGLGRALSVDVIAEGIETQEQLMVMTVLGCRSGQGYHLGRSMPLDQAIALVATSSRAAHV